MFSLKEILPRIYHLEMDRAYDLAMHFLRAQEYYESPKFRGEIFSLVNYMEWYSREHGKGAFTYCSDWSGFNVPSYTLKDLYGTYPNLIPDPNKYDAFMGALYTKLRDRSGGKDFYLIGTSKERAPSVLNHELAHGMYHTDPKYREETRNKLYSLCFFVEDAKEVLRGMGYHDAVLEDELQAYLSTGLCAELESAIDIPLNVLESFFQAFWERKVELEQT